MKRFFGVKEKQHEFYLLRCHIAFAREERNGRASGQKIPLRPSTVESWEEFATYNFFLGDETVGWQQKTTAEWQSNVLWLSEFTRPFWFLSVVVFLLKFAVGLETVEFHWSTSINIFKWINQDIPTVWVFFYFQCVRIPVIEYVHNFRLLQWTSRHRRPNPACVFLVDARYWNNFNFKSILKLFKIQKFKFQTAKRPLEVRVPDLPENFLATLESK